MTPGPCTLANPSLQEAQLIQLASEYDLDVVGRDRRQGSGGSGSGRTTGSPTDASGDDDGDSPPFESPTLSPSLTFLAHFRVASGHGCEVDSNGCVTDGAGDYGSNERCTVEVLFSGLLSSVGAFDTESIVYDYLNINGQWYGGYTGPIEVSVSAGSTFTWSSDGNRERAGWTLCLEGAYTSDR